jgi:hypothetical protein
MNSKNKKDATKMAFPLNMIKRINLLLTKMHYIIPFSFNTATTFSICFTPMCNGTKGKT